MPPVSGILNSTFFGIFASHRVLLRSFSFVLVLALIVATTPVSIHAETAADERMLEMHNIHTKENIKIVYKRNGKFVPEALKKLDHFMRDWRRNVTIKIDPNLYDIIWKAHKELGSKKPIKLISGHRSAKTNNKLRRSGRGQARRSLHITGKAADVNFPDISTKQLRNAALILQRGGVGYYPKTGIPFVHLDTGPVRHWPRLPRQELALLFPSGKSKHVPSDRRPLKKSDFRVALAKLRQKGGKLPLALRKLMNKGQPRTVLASLSSDLKTDGIASKVPLPAHKPKTKSPKARIVLASLTPSFDHSQQPKPEPALARSPSQQPDKSDETASKKASIMPSSQMRLASRNSDADLFDEPAQHKPSPSDMSDPEAFEDDLDELLMSQPYPILPYMTDTPVAHLDFSSKAPNVPLTMVHVLFGEKYQVLDTPFQEGLQIAHMFRAQKFHGTAVDTVTLKQVTYRKPSKPVKTAQSR
ncbi:MAG: DUF882 domain-containing protein [Alphaproteobacteria bacterium]